MAKNTAALIAAFYLFFAASGMSQRQVINPATGRLDIIAPAGISWSVTGQCLGSNGGALTINASLQIVCSDDDGGGGNHNLLSATHPDTAAASPVRGDIVIANLTPAWTKLALGAATAGKYAKSDGADVVISSGSASGVGTPTACTNQFVTGLTLNADAAPTSTCTTATLASAQFANQGTTTTVLHGNAAGNPSFAAVTSADTSGTFPANAHNLLSTTHGDTLAASPVLGDLTYGNATPAWQRLAGNTTTTKNFLTQTGDGAISAAPAWGTITDGDIPAAITRDTEVNVQGTANEITSSGSGVAPTLSIASTFRITGKTATAPIKTGTAAPATCTVGDYFFDTDATAGLNNFGCTATNVWTLLGDGAGSGSPGGVDKNVQFKDVDAFGGVANNTSANKQFLSQVSTGTPAWANAAYRLDWQKGSTITVTSTETNLRTITVNGGVMASGGCLEIAYSFTNDTGTASVTYLLYYGATSASFGSYSGSARQAGISYICNDPGLTGAQTLFSGAALQSVGASGTVSGTAAIDSTANQTLKITGQSGGANQSVTFHGWIVKVVN